ncbi:MAG: hypothetical protein LBI14_03060 [Treponema sp.]|jgi:hypothetical protein|nr:hypothetical protein [Treponema sp.]
MDSNAENKVQFVSRSEFYRQMRPEFFSDSENIADIILPREVLAFEIEKISTNQKQDLFETLCRRLAERLICPNLIPQVGPTGGGDGKTDSETYSVSKLISERWYIPRDGWKNDEKWAFAFSAKKDWKAKIESDIKKIIDTNRGYTKFFFISNQKISSKKKKDEQGSLIKEYGIDVTIFDAEWIIENIYRKNLIELTAETLNMSDVYKGRKKRLGKNDTTRLAEVEEIERKIGDCQYYSHGDIQLIHDAIRCAVLSRMLELPRDEVEAKFVRAERLCNEYSVKGLLTKIIYQKAWTYINYYDDYPNFISETIKLKELINEKSTSIEIEWILNLFNIYRSIHHSKSDDIPNRDIIYNDFEKYIINILSLRLQKQEMPCSALVAETYLALIDLVRVGYTHEDPSALLKNLSEIISKSKKYIEYPFEPICQIITELGYIFADNAEYDILIENIVNISSLRESEINSGIIYFNRGIQKFRANKFKESIVYLGRAVFRLAKEETSDNMIFALTILAESYKELALPWASYNCLITAASLELKKLSEENKITQQFLSIIKSILSTEILLGRLPNIFFWHRLFLTLYQQYGDKTSDIPDNIMLDGCLAVRLLHIDQKENNLKYLPHILESQGLLVSSAAVLYLLGYEDEIIEHYSYLGFKNNLELGVFFQKSYSQPLIEQVYSQTDFQNSDLLALKTIIIGCEVQFEFVKNKRMFFLVETILVLIESILATSVGKIFPHIKNVIISVIEDNSIDYFLQTKDTETNRLTLKVNPNNISTGDHNLKVRSFLTFFSFILANYFYTDNIKNFIDNIFSKENLNERLAVAFNHEQLSSDCMGNNTKIFFDDWKDDRVIYENKRPSPIIFPENITKNSQSIALDKETFENVPHNKFEIHSIIDDSLWNKATWKATGVAALPEEGILGLALIFDNFDAGRKIFDEWNKLIGKIDKEELIDITVIKGIDKHNPYWYRVVVTANQEKIIINKDKFLILKLRVNEMEAKDHGNLTIFENAFQILKRYILFPSSTKGLLPEHLKYGIVKTKITMINAWQIGINDPYQAAIHDTDEPILPEGIDNVPILSLLKQMKEKKKGYSNDRI